MRENLLKNSSGKSTVETFLLITLVIAVVYFSIKYAPPFITYYQVTQAFFNVGSQSAHLDDGQFKDELRRRLKSISPPFYIDDVAMTRVGNTLILDVLYHERVYHPFVDKPHILAFNPHIELNIAKIK